MLNSLKSLIVVLMVLLPVLYLARKPLSVIFTDESEYKSRQWLWVALTLAEFLARDFWIFVAIAGFLLLRHARRERNPAALYLLILLAVPPMARNVPGFGIINYLFTLEYLRLLALLVLLPAAILISRRPDALPFGKIKADYWVIGYFVFRMALYFRASSMTTLLRSGFEFFLDVWLPYFVMSRFFRDISEMRQAVAAFVLATAAAGALAVPESIKHWSFYQTVQSSLNLEWGVSIVMRGDAFRAQGSTGQPISLGLMLCVGLGFWLYVRRYVSNPVYSWGIFSAIFAGLVATLSRGPWVGAAAMLMAFVFFAPGSTKRLFVWGAVIGAIAVAVIVSPYGDTVLSYLPFTKNNVDSGSSEYRTRLFQISMNILSYYPFFGTPFFMSYMEELRQGQGIIDLVNTYLAIALPTGYVGLCIWLLPILMGLVAAVRTAKAGGHDAGSDVRYLAAALGASLVGVLITLGTVSPIGVIPVLLWSLVGMTFSVQRLALNEASSPARYSKF